MANLCILQSFRDSNDDLSCPFCSYTFNQEEVDQLPDDLIFFNLLMDSFENHSDDDETASTMSDDVFTNQPIVQERSTVASASNNNDPDELTCRICCNEFDDGNQKPKMLPCTHTVCQLCLMVYYITKCLK